MEVAVENLPQPSKGGYFAAEPKKGEKGSAVQSFQEMNLSKPLLKAIKESGFKAALYWLYNECDLRRRRSQPRFRPAPSQLR